MSWKIKSIVVFFRLLSNLSILRNFGRNKYVFTPPPNNKFTSTTLSTLISNNGHRCTQQGGKYIFVKKEGTLGVYTSSPLAIVPLSCKVGRSGPSSPSPSVHDISSPQPSPHSATLYLKLHCHSRRFFGFHPLYVNQTISAVPPSSSPLYQQRHIFHGFPHFIGFIHILTNIFT